MKETNNVKYPDHICRFNDGFDCECYCKGREGERKEMVEKINHYISKWKNDDSNKYELRQLFTDLQDKLK